MHSFTLYQCCLLCICYIHKFCEHVLYFQLSSALVTNVYPILTTVMYNGQDISLEMHNIHCTFSGGQYACTSKIPIDSLQLHYTESFVNKIIRLQHHIRYSVQFNNLTQLDHQSVFSCDFTYLFNNNAFLLKIFYKFLIPLLLLLLFQIPIV